MANETRSGFGTPGQTRYQKAKQELREVEADYRAAVADLPEGVRQEVELIEVGFRYDVEPIKGAQKRHDVFHAGTRLRLKDALGSTNAYSLACQYFVRAIDFIPFKEVVHE